LFVNIFYDSILLQLLKHTSLFGIGKDGEIFCFCHVF